MFQFINNTKWNGKIYQAGTIVSQDNLPDFEKALEGGYIKKATKIVEVAVIDEKKDLWPTKKEIMEKLVELKIEFDPRATKDALAALLPQE